MHTSTRGWTAGALLLLLTAGVFRGSLGDTAHAQTPPADVGIAAPDHGARFTASTRVARAASGAVDKILVFLVENHSMEQMRSGMPFLAGLADRYARSDDYHAITHPSLPNYLAIAGGTTAGVTNDAPPSDNPVTGRSVFLQALRHGRTARVYADGMPARCSLQDGGRQYAVRHNPWAYHAAERAACLRHDVRLVRLRGDIRGGRLPNVGMVVPNVCHDAHDCSLATADSWLRRELTAVMRGPDWAAGHLAVVVTADEDDWNHGNRVLTTVIAPGLRDRVVHAPLTHYSLSRALSEVAGAAPLRNAARARSLLGAFGLHASR